MQTIHQTNHHAPAPRHPASANLNDQHATTHVPMLPPGTPAFTALVTEECVL